MNNFNGRADPDAEDSDDKKIVADIPVNIKLEQIEREMLNVMELQEQMKKLVEDIDNIDIKNEFRKAMAAFENVRQNIIDETQFEIKFKNPEANKLTAAENTSLTVEEGAINVEAWT